MDMSLAPLRRLMASLVLVTWTAGIVLPALGAVHVPDLVDGDILLAVPHPVTQIEPAYPSLADGHCAICHLQRAARGAVLVATGALVSPAPIRPELAPERRALASPGFRATSPRAPPFDFLPALS
jgi:hypothetical protein